MSTTLTVSSIPHRPPFLFVDEIIEVSKDHIVATKFVDPASDFFRGHYPGTPVMPGVLICESIFQAGALLIAQRMGGYRKADGVPVLTRIRDARFKRIVRPGETLRLQVSIEGEVDNAFFMAGDALVDGVLSVRVSFACMLTRTDGAL